MFNRQGCRAAWAMVALAATVLGAGRARGGLTVYAGPYGEETGYSFYSSSVTSGLDIWLITGNSVVTRAQSHGTRSVRWDAAGNVDELDSLGTRSDGYTVTGAIAVNSWGGATGYSTRWSETDQDLGSRAVRWDATGGVVELEPISLRSDGYTRSAGRSLIDTGTVVGWGKRFGALDKDLGYGAVRWEAGGTAATELESLWTRSNGYTDAGAGEVNASGTAVGYARRYDEADVDLGYRAMRWDAGGTAAVELETLGVRGDGYASSRASLINDAGVMAGIALKYDDQGSNLGYRAVRWASGGTEVEELGTLGQDADGYSYTAVMAMNDAGMIAGYAWKYDASGKSLGQRAVRWDASGTAAVGLPTLNDHAEGTGYGMALDINEQGLIVGASNVGEGMYFDLDNGRAALWTPAGRVIDLNSVIVPEGPWGLERPLAIALAIDDSGWISGMGPYYPDGVQTPEGYEPVWLLHVTYFSPGDFNIDGRVDVQDINPFVAAMGGEEGYRGYLAGRMSALGIDAGELELIVKFVDPSGDGLINVQDINPFVGLLAGAGVMVDASVIPEPGVGAVVLAGVILGVIRRRGWKR